MELRVNIDVADSHLHPVEISIIYNDDGSVQNIDWREGIVDDSDDYEFLDNDEPQPCDDRLETIWEKEWSDEDTDTDPDYIPTVDTCGEYSSDDSDY